MFIIVAFGNFFHIFKKILLKFAEVAPVGAWIEIMLVTGARKAVMEVAPVGAWIEISGYTEGRRRSGKSPLLGRGLKCLIVWCMVCFRAEVAPVGAWIEICSLYSSIACIAEVAPVGAWIEISRAYGVCCNASKSPLLGRGLKCQINQLIYMLNSEVAPVGAWIEIWSRCSHDPTNSRSRPCWGVD